MGGLVRWNPFKRLRGIRDRFNSIFFHLPVRRDMGHEAMIDADWAPADDITGNDKEFLIKAEIPKVDEKDVTVAVQDGILTIQGERKREKRGKGKCFRGRERYKGKFVRFFSLPEDAGDDLIRTEFSEGVLIVHLPRREKARHKAIEVKVEQEGVGRWRPGSLHKADSA